MSGVATGLEYIWAFILMLSVLVTVHEFGHYIVAKWCGVKVLKFSIGFGSPIGFGRYRLAWTRGETEYVICWIPLGGFVKMLGEIPGEEATPETQAEWGRSMVAQPLWKKLSIVLAGPAMNLLLPVIVLVGFMWVGSQQPISQIGTVDPASPAAEAGLLPGDRIVAIDGEPVIWWSDVAERIEPATGRTLALSIERDGGTLDLPVPVGERPRLNIFQEETPTPWIGIQAFRQAAVVGVPSLQSPAGGAGIASGDLVQSIDGLAIEEWRELVAHYEAARAPVRLQISRGDKDNAEVFERTVPALGSIDQLGLIPAVVVVAKIKAGGAAEAAGLLPGDLILSLDGERVGSWGTFRDTVMVSGGRPLDLEYTRNGEYQSTRLSAQPVLDEETGMEHLLIGIEGRSPLFPATDLQRFTDPRVSVPRAVGRVAEFTGLLVGGFGRMLTGQISRKNIRGPIEIARQSHDALEAGWDVFLSLLMLISVNLAVINLLPIPVLDGGQALIYSIEGIKRSSLSMRAREMAQVAGLAAILMLMGLAFWNDISAYWSTVVDWLVGS
jgi:regulator of sigma E protease